jgi:hypothetical protein
VLGTVAIDDLRAHMRDRRVLHAPAACARPETIFSQHAFERLLGLPSVADALHVSVKGKVVRASAIGALDPQGALQPLVLRKFARMGASLVIDRLEQHHPGLKILAAGAERLFRSRVSTTAIASFGGVGAYKPHYDTGDLVVLQLAGAKTWSFLGEPVAGSGVERKGRVPEHVSQKVTLSVGDMLFVPSGQSHVCTTDVDSLHLVFVVEQPTGADLLTALMDRKPDYLAPLQPFLGDDALAGQIALFKTALIADLQTTDLAALLYERSARRSAVAAVPIFDETASAPAEGLARLTISLPPPARVGQAWSAGGATVSMDSASAAIVNALAAGPMDMAELCAQVAAACGPAAAQAALADLRAQGIVRVDA